MSQPKGKNIKSTQFTWNQNTIQFQVISQKPLKYHTQYIYNVLKTFKLISCQEDVVSIFPNIKSQDKKSLNFANNAINP